MEKDLYQCSYCHRVYAKHPDTVDEDIFCPECGDEDHYYIIRVCVPEGDE